MGHQRPSKDSTISLKKGGDYIYSLIEMQEILKSRNYSLCEYSKPVKNTQEYFVCKDESDYLIWVNINKVKHRPESNFLRFGKSNPYSIYNINHEAKLKGFDSICIDTNFSSKERLWFKCGCGNKFQTNYWAFLSGHKTKCGICTGDNRVLTYDNVKNNLAEHGYNLLVEEEDYKGITLTPLVCSDHDGYKYEIIYHRIMNRNKEAEKFHSCNPFSLDNVKIYLVNNNMPYECISEEFISCDKPLKFRCKRCGDVIEQTWRNINRINKATQTKGRLCCPNCDYTVESTHASVLKQLFLHEHPDTTVEDRSFINPETNYAMPTDIVNHRLKIAIEVQSQWHDFEDKKKRDRIKKEYWLNRGYKFYDPDIRDYSILEMCQLFFDINELPDYLDYSLNKKIDLRKIQKMLNNHESVIGIAESLNISPHRIYDAIYNHKLEYPSDYCNNCYVGVNQYTSTGDYIGTFTSIAQAARANGIKPKTLATAISRGLKCGGFLWKRTKDDIVENA